MAPTPSVSAIMRDTAGGMIPSMAILYPVRLAVRRCATLWTGKKPVVDVMLLQVA